MPSIETSDSKLKTEHGLIAILHTSFVAVEGLSEVASTFPDSIEFRERLVEALEATGLEPAIVTGAGTGTYEIDTELGLYTELQAGSYIFMDVEYADAALWPDGGRPFETALFVQTTVVSANHSGQATTDAGLKAFATDGPLPLIARGAPEGATYRFTGDEFGCITLPPGEELALGTVVECMVPHCDPTVNLHNYYHCVRGDVLVDIWPIDARGKY